MKKITFYTTNLIILTLSLNAFGSNITTLAQFKLYAKNSARCSNSVKMEDGIEELKYALNKNAIDETTYNWGVENGFFQILNRKTTVIAVCPWNTSQDN